MRDKQKSYQVRIYKFKNNDFGWRNGKKAEHNPNICSSSYEKIILDYVSWVNNTTQEKILTYERIKIYNLKKEAKNIYQ